MTNEAKAATPQQEATIENLDGIFDTDVIESEQEEVETPTPDQDNEEGKGEKDPEQSETEGKKPEEEEGKEQNPETPSGKDQLVPLSAMLDERRKRQEAEDKLAKFEEEQPNEQIPDPVEDPEGYKTFMSDKQAQESLKTKINLSRSILMSMEGYKDDYQDKENHFIEMCKTNPTLAAQMNASDNPAKFAYDSATEDLEVQKLRDPSYRETLKEELRKEILAENGHNSEDKPAKPSKEETPKPAKPTATNLPNLTNPAAAGSNTTPKVQEFTDLDDVFED